MEKFSLYFILFLIYSFIGWSIEVIGALHKNKKFINRGFMLGPYCPIYGYSALIMILYLNQYKNNPPYSLLTCRSNIFCYGIPN